MNTQPLHMDAEYAARSQFGQRIVNGIYTLGLIVGISVAELTEGTLVANLTYDHVAHPAPLYIGDTIHVETEILDKRESKTKPDRGLVRVKHIGRKQDGTIVCEVERTAMFLKRPK